MKFIYGEIRYLFELLKLKYEEEKITEINSQII